MKRTTTGRADVPVQRVAIIPPERHACTKSCEGGAMRFKLDSAVQPITRRSLLGTAAVVAAAPALDQTTAPACPIGPPPHDKGPRVWMDMDQVELDAAYSQIFYAPLQAQITRRLASSSELARARLGAPRREAYGPTAPEKLDI